MNKPLKECDFCHEQSQVSIYWIGDEVPETFYYCYVDYAHTMELWKKGIKSGKLKLKITFLNK